MLIELPIQLINKKESDIVGSENAETMTGFLTIRIDCIQAIHRDIPTRSILETKTGSTYLILIPYADMADLWSKALGKSAELTGPFMIHGQPRTAKKKTEEKIFEDPIKIICENCGGINLEDSGEQGSPEGPIIIKKCKDCGVVQSFK